MQILDIQFPLSSLLALVRLFNLIIGLAEMLILWQTVVTTEVHTHTQIETHKHALGPWACR